MYSFSKSSENPKWVEDGNALSSDSDLLPAAFEGF